MSGFKVGDRVRVLAPSMMIHGQVATIVAHAEDSKWAWRVLADGESDPNSWVPMDAAELVIVKKVGSGVHVGTWPFDNGRRP
jgi:hypothetical protein